MKPAYNKTLLAGLAITGFILFPSCTPQPNTSELIEDFRARVETLVKAQTFMDYRNRVFGDQSNQDSLYTTHASLFTLENIRIVREAESQEQDSLQQKRLRYLIRFLSVEFINKQTAPLADFKNNIEATATVHVDGETIPYTGIHAMITNERSQVRRERLYHALDPVLDSLNRVLTQVEETDQRVAKELGYASYNTMVEQLNQISLNTFKEMAEHVIAETDSSYATLLKEVLTTILQLSPERFHLYDTGPLFRRTTFDKFFPEAAMMDQLKRTYMGMSIDIDAHMNLKVDAGKRKNKNPRAACYPIDVPNDIRLSITPIGGFDDYSALFHEMGHGLHYANTRENALEFKYLGEQTVTETYAFLSEYLLANQAWLRIHCTMSPSALKDFVSLLAFDRLFMIRRYCAKFLYELELHSGTSDPAKAYVNIVARTLQCQPNPSDAKRYLTDLDAFYYSASYLRAWFLEAQLSKKLTQDFGANWFENHRAGEFLLSLWAHGDRLTGDELVQRLGYEKISPEALLEQIRMMVILSTKPRF